MIESEAVNGNDKELFRLLESQSADEENTIASLGLLGRMLRDCYQKPAFILIDEYDVPIAKALGTPRYDRMRDIVEHMLSYVCKTNDSVKAVVLTGCSCSPSLRP